MMYKCFDRETSNGPYPAILWTYDADAQQRHFLFDSFYRFAHDNSKK